MFGGGGGRTYATAPPAHGWQPPFFVSRERPASPSSFGATPSLASPPHESRGRLLVIRRAVVRTTRRRAGRPSARARGDGADRFFDAPARGGFAPCATRGT